MKERKYLVYGFFEFTIESSKNPQKIKDAINKILETEGISSNDFEISIDLLKDKEDEHKKEANSGEEEEKEEKPENEKGKDKAKPTAKGKRQNTRKKAGRKRYSSHK